MRIAIATFLIVIVVVGSARAEDCSFPDAVPLSGEATSAAEMRVAFLEFCPSFAEYQPWAGVDVIDANGKPLGVTGDLLVSVGTLDPKIFIEIMGPDDLSKFAVAFPSADVGGRFDSSTFVLSPDDELAVHSAENALIFGGIETQVLPLGQLGPDGMANLVATAGANPYPSRMIVRFESDPASATVTVGNSTVGPTATQAWVAKGALSRIVLNLEGYRACRFEDGDFEEPTTSNSAHFYCALEEN